MRGNKLLGLTEQKPSLAHKIAFGSSTYLTDEETPQEVTDVHRGKALTATNFSKSHPGDAHRHMD